MNKISKYILIPAAFLVVFLLVRQFSDADRFRHNVPCGIEVERSGYSDSGTNGIGGPGDNFAIFAVFDISEDSANKIAANGLNFLRQLECPPAGSATDRRRKYRRWEETPSLLTSRLYAPTNNIETYLERRSIRLEIPIDIISEAQHSLDTNGNYLGEQSHGFLLVNANTRKLYYIFAD